MSRFVIPVTRIDVSIVIPAYNEARRLPMTLDGWRAFLGQQAYASEVIVVDDGSSDFTFQAAADGGARAIRLEPNQGKGAAVRAGVLAADGRVIAYADADMNVAPSNLARALEYLDAAAPEAEPRGRNAGEPGPAAAGEPGRSAAREPGRSAAREPGRSAAGEPGLAAAGKSGRADLVIGRRNLAEYAAAEGPLRLAAGGLVQVTRRALVLRGIQDTQCGFKVFRRDLARSVFARTRLRSFAFDIEVLFVARKLGARIVEMPVATTYRAESTFNVRKHLPRFLRDIVQIRLNDLAGQYDARE